MPMLYGEGKKAFIRLQEEIMRNNSDHSRTYDNASGRPTVRFPQIWGGDADTAMNCIQSSLGNDLEVTQTARS